MAVTVFVKFDAKNKIIFSQGEWILNNIEQIKHQFKKIIFPTGSELILDGHAITKMDSAGAWILDYWIKKLEKKNIKVHLKNFSEQHVNLFSLVTKKLLTPKKIPQPLSLNWLAQIGKTASLQAQEAIDYLSFIGQLTVESFRIFAKPPYLRMRELAGILYKAGFQALPIVAFLAFTVGVVIAHQTGLQFQKYGANVFVVDLIGFSILREFGPLITAIIIAGRTGSAYTAQLGIMQVNQEIDALKTMGVTPGELLLIPRIVALLIALPLLTMWADIFGVLGGMIATNNLLNIAPHEFLDRFQREVPIRGLLIGLGKAPVFAFIIATIGCFQGMRVERNADSVGKLTTRSVVLSIFFILVADAIFSILLSRYKL